MLLNARVEVTVNGRVLIAGYLVVLGACSRVEPEQDQQPVARATDELIVQPSIAFVKRNLRVCFRTPTIPLGDRQVIADAANEWGRATGLSFWGFGNCTTPVSNAEIGILQDESTLFTGQGTGGNPYGAISLNFTYASWPTGSGGAACRTNAATRESCLHNVAIHEIGHVIGFAHEQLRDPNEPLLGLSSCATQPFDGYLSGSFFVGPWDLFSIMNYCDPNPLTSMRTISETDAIGAERLYGVADGFGDLNADGRADAISVEAGRIVARLSNGAGFGSEVVFSSTAFFGANGTYFADVDADGRTDVIAVGTSDIQVRRSNGTTLLPAETWLGTTFVGRHGTFFEDVTGDGAADLITVDETNVIVRRASPAAHAFGNVEVWLNKDSISSATGTFAFPLDSIVTLNGSPFRHIPFSVSIAFGETGGALSGQGRPMKDLVLFTTSGASAFRSTGNNFLADAQTAFFPRPSRGAFLSDVDGDGLSDLVLVGSPGIDGSFHGNGAGVVARISTSTGFGGTSRVISTREFIGDRGTFFANVDAVPGDEALIITANRIVVRKRIAPPTTTPFFGGDQTWSSNFHGRPADVSLTGTPYFAVWQPSDGVWRVASNSPQQFGATGDIPVPGDWDRDGAVDMAVWRPSTGEWFALRSSDGLTLAQQWGASGDVPVPGDYDGDGWVDFAVWRPSEGMWYVLRSTTGTALTRQWGTAGDVPVPGRYDGDALTDFAVWRPSSGTWFVVNSTNNTTRSQNWGVSTDIPTPGDYDGDGRTDFAIYRPSDGTWDVRNSVSGAISTVQWGGEPNDVPIPGRYHDALDSRTDYAVWRRSSSPDGSEFFVKSSLDGSTFGAFLGTSGDVPIARK